MNAATAVEPALFDRSASVARPVIAVALVVAAVSGLAVGISDEPLTALALAAAVSIVVAIAAVPAMGAWMWLLIGPLIVGIARGEGLLVLRPNEALLLLACLGIALRIWWQISRGERFLPKLGAVDAAMALLLVTGLIVPLLLRYGRGLAISQDDVLYGLVFAKYFALYGLVRLSINTSRQVAICLCLALISGAIVAIVAILQVNGLFNVPQLLYAYYDAPFEAVVGPVSSRGSSTVASSFGLADLMAICLAIVIAWLPLQPRSRPLLIAAGVLFLAGSAAAGTFSGYIGCAVAVVAVGVVTRRLLIQLAIALPASMLAAAAFWPVIATRLAGFDSRLALPRSWIGRLENLEGFFWPELFSGFNWLFGVRPAARVLAPETWRTWVYIESGHTWLLWTGGVPLLLAFLVFAWVVSRRLFKIATTNRGAVGVAATAGFAATAMIFVLMLFDPHLTVRGSADLFFPLLALALVPLGLPDGTDMSAVEGAEIKHTLSASSAASVTMQAHR